MIMLRNKLAGCDPFHFGKGCEENCSCQSTEVCDNENGTCFPASESTCRFHGYFLHLKNGFQFALKWMYSEFEIIQLMFTYYVISVHSCNTKSAQLTYRVSNFH